MMADLILSRPAVFLSDICSRKEKEVKRAWTETNLEHLHHNVAVLQDVLPPKCKVMAVVKAEAYGHGAIKVSRSLYAMGIRHFAVATLEEAIELRKAGIRGEILILGYTDPMHAKVLARYHISQTIVDMDHARKLQKAGKKIPVHIAVDTGMHRLGIPMECVEDIEAVYTFSNLTVKGIFSHLSVADSLDEDKEEFTKWQIHDFFQLIDILKSKKIKTGNVHLQASYGILNYPSLPCDLARAGIVLYGVRSSHVPVRNPVELHPVLSLKAKIASVRTIQKGESAGYGRDFFAEKEMKIAVVTIGYADGIPRNYANAHPTVLLHGKEVSVIGRICMDQMLIDVSGLKKIQPGDVVTLIGRDGEKEIRCEDMAQACKTITNELLSRLGRRLIKI